ncbi:MAG TPA: SDR family NAD(P)-dependent oxidoreductase, partial [Pseudomonas sp.]
MQIRDKVFLITGGASGLGAAAAQALVEAGGKVVLVDLDASAANAMAEALGPNALGVAADIRDEQAARHAVATAREHFGALHGLVNCAGVAGGEKVLGRNG